MADPFTLFGAGNGWFRTNSEKINVSGFYDWLTLGGYRKGDTSPVTQAQIDTSLYNAMRLVYNTRLINADADSDSVYASIDATASGGTITPNEPKDRIEDEYITYLDSDSDSNTTLDFSVSANVGITLPFGIETHAIRMYNGATSDESNFVGWGVSTEYENEFIDVSASGSQSFTVASISNLVRLGSYLEDEYEITSVDDGRVRVSVNQINGMHLLALSSWQGTGSDFGLETEEVSFGNLGSRVRLWRPAQTDPVVPRTLLCECEISFTNFTLHSYTT